MQNLFTEERNLRNEKSVEKNFIYPLVEWLGYGAANVRVDESLESIDIPQGNRRELYRPDVVLFANKHPRVVVEVKSPQSNLVEAMYQVASYALMINRRYKSINPIRYCIVSNGNCTYILNWDCIQPFMKIEFSEWNLDNLNVEWLRNNLSRTRFESEMWYKVNWIGEQPVKEEAAMLINNDAISWATITRFLHVARHDEKGYGAALENPWHRAAYFQLVQLGWIAPEEWDVRQFEELKNMRFIPKGYLSRLIGFNLTESGKKVLKLVKSDPEFRVKFNVEQFFHEKKLRENDT